MRRRGANSCEAQNRHASAANPKFAQVCGVLGCELRVQKRHYKDRVASVLIDSEVRTSAPQMLTNFGIGTLVPRTRSSHKFAECSDANFRVQKRHYKDRIASVLIDSEVRTSAPQMLTNFGIGTLAVNRTLSGRLAKHKFLRSAYAALRGALCGLVLVVASMPTRTAQAAHAIAMHGTPAMPEDFAAVPYANPDAPKGGRLIEGVLGTFDSLNPLIVQGLAVQTVRGYVIESLMARGYDEPFTLYGLLAQSIETDDARTFVTFTLDPAAHFSDGVAVTADDVAFSLQLLRDH